MSKIEPEICPQCLSSAHIKISNTEFHSSYGNSVYTDYYKCICDNCGFDPFELDNYHVDRVEYNIPKIGVKSPTKALKAYNKLINNHSMHIEKETKDIIKKTVDIDNPDSMINQKFKEYKEEIKIPSEPLNLKVSPEDVKDLQVLFEEDKDHDVVNTKSIINSCINILRFTPRGKIIDPEYLVLSNWNDKDTVSKIRYFFNRFIYDRYSFIVVTIIQLNGKGRVEDAVEYRRKILEDLYMSYNRLKSEVKDERYSSFKAISEFPIIFINNSYYIDNNIDIFSGFSYVDNVLSIMKDAEEADIVYVLDNSDRESCAEAKLGRKIANIFNRHLEINDDICLDVVDQNFNKLDDKEKSQLLSYYVNK